MAIVYGDFMYYVKLKQPIVDREELEHLYSELRCVGVTAFVQIFHEVEYKLIDCLHDGSRTDLGSFHNSESDERSCKFVIGDSTDFFTAVRGLSENLSSLGVDGTVFCNIVNAIIDYGRHRRKHVANRGRKVLPLHVSIKKEKRVYLHYGRYLMHMATIRESTAQHTDDGVVPASVPALGKLLKRVRMDEGESENPSRRTTTTESDDEKGLKQNYCCTLCLGDFGSSAISMPCSHLFHGGCIFRWLSMSHYCPACGYQVPTSDQNQHHV
ncbi:uncharacterized protein LOC18043226 [Citrus clementina]|uniref:uncharacterized protein LOC18043226 n=1 Tax=Citrus clementina TaxID=85681 RepID=UPI000CED1E8C|nr:uncharacterized protein LOC18043226 [Citrus x clementina]